MVGIVIAERDTHMSLSNLACGRPTSRCARNARHVDDAERWEHARQGNVTKP